MALFVFAVGVLLDVAAFFVARWSVGRLTGAYGGRFTVATRSRSSAILRQRSLIAAAGPMGSYLAAGLLLAVGAATGGNVKPDEASMRVTVVSGFPADAAGIQNGDRIVSVDGEATTDWEHLRAQVRAHAGGVAPVVVERDGATLTFSPRVGADGRMGVGAPLVNAELGPGGLLDQAFVEPARVEGRYVAGVASWLVRGRPQTEVTGPVGVMKAGAKAGPNLGVSLRFVGMIDAAWLWIAVLLALVLLPWPMREA